MKVKLVVELEMTDAEYKRFESLAETTFMREEPRKRWSLSEKRQAKREFVSNVIVKRVREAMNVDSRMFGSNER